MVDYDYNVLICIEDELDNFANYDDETGNLIIEYVEASVYCTMKIEFGADFNRERFFEAFDKIVDEKGLTQA